MAEPRRLPAYRVEPLQPGPPNRQPPQIHTGPAGQNIQRLPEPDSPRLLHKIDGVAPRDRNRNKARHPCQQLTDNDRVSLSAWNGQSAMAQCPPTAVKQRQGSHPTAAYSDAYSGP